MEKKDQALSAAVLEKRRWQIAKRVAVARIKVEVAERNLDEAESNLRSAKHELGRAEEQWVRFNKGEHNA